MSRLAKTGGTLLGLAALGTFVAALGGPNVFSTFSNVLSTIRPKTEIAVDGKKEEKTENKVSTESEVEEKKDLITESREEKKEEIVPASATEPVQTIPQETRTEQQVQPEVISQVTDTPVKNLRSGSTAPKGPAEPSGKKEYPDHKPATQSGDSEGTGIWCGMSGGSYMLKKGQTCGNVTFETVKGYYPNYRNR